MTAIPSSTQKGVGLKTSAPRRVFARDQRVRLWRISCYNGATLQVSGDLVPTPVAGTHCPLATPAARLIAFVIDFIVFVSILLCCFIAGAVLLLLSSNFGKVPPSDPAYTLFPAIIAAAIPIWDLILILGWVKGGRSPGKYVTNTRVTGRHGQPIGPVRALVRLLAHPWAFPTYALLAGSAFLYTLGQPFAFTSGLLALASLLGGAVSLVSILTDPRHRAVHDVLAGTQVRRQP